jgi:hypothetical protein
MRGPAQGPPADGSHAGRCPVAGQSPRSVAPPADAVPGSSPIIRRCGRVFSPGCSGPTFPESPGPAVRDARPCVDGNSSSSWFRPSHDLEQQSLSQPSPTSAPPARHHPGSALRPATPWRSDSVASRSKTGAAAIRCRTVRTSGATLTPSASTAMWSRRFLEPESPGQESMELWGQDKSARTHGSASRPPCDTRCGPCRTVRPRPGRCCPHRVAAAVETSHGSETQRPGLS